MDDFEIFDEMEHTETDIQIELIDDEDGINVWMCGLDNDFEEIIRLSKN